jgi:hypothetical protein
VESIAAGLPQRFAPDWAPLLARIPRKDLAQYSQVLRRAGQKPDAAAYFSRSLDLAIAGAAVVLLAGIVLYPATAIAFSLATLFASLLISFAYPFLLSSQRARQAECELGVTLQSVSLLLEFGQGFDDALAEAPKGRTVEALMKRYLRRVEAGSSPAAAFESLSGEVEGQAWKRACSQLCFAYQHGGEGSYLSNAADELYALSRQHHKRFGQRLSLLGLLFVASGCLVPALYGAYVLLSPLLEQKVNSIDIYIAYFLAFPAFCLCVAVAATFAAPPLPDFEYRIESAAIAGKGKNRERDEIIGLAIAGIAAFAVLLLFAPFQKVKLPLALLGLFLPYGFLKAARMVSESAGRAELEAGLPTALLMASTYASDSIDQVPGAIARAGMGKASEAFARADRLVRSGYSFEYSLARTSASAKSALFSLSCTFISAAYRNGFEAGPALQKISRYVSDTLEMRRELASSLLVTKYTVLASAAFLVPFIISVLLKIVATFPESQGPALSAVMPSVQAYLVLFSAIGGFFVGLIEEDLPKGLSYALFCAPVSLVVFAIFSAA